MKDQPMSAIAAPPMKILIADDHWVVRESLKHVAQGLNEAFQTIEAESFLDALNKLDEQPDIGLVLVDLIMPGFNEFDGLQLLRTRFPGTPIVVVSIHEDPNYVLRAISHGVVGYIPKSSSADEIRNALTRVVSGEVAFPRDILTSITAGTDALRKPAGVAAGATGARAGGIDRLTAREREVLCHLGAGKSLFDISDDLRISRQTVRVHLGNAMKKLEIPTREALIRFSVERISELRAGPKPDRGV